MIASPPGAASVRGREISGSPGAAEGDFVAKRNEHQFVRTTSCQLCLLHL